MSLFKNSKTRLRNLMLVVLPFFIAICVFGYLAFSSVRKLISGSGEIAASYSNSIEDMNIYLRDNATDLQKDLFKDLQKAYESEDDNLKAELTAKSFIADFYTWTNKHGSYDVGGVYYCTDRPNVELQGRDTFYHYVTYYIEEYGAENLLEVTSIETVELQKLEENYVIDGVDGSFPVWWVKLKWEYADHPGFTENEYYSKGVIKVIKSDRGRFEIVEAY